MSEVRAKSQTAAPGATKGHPLQTTWLQISSCTSKTLLIVSGHQNCTSFTESFRSSSSVPACCRQHGRLFGVRVSTHLPEPQLLCVTRLDEAYVCTRQRCLNGCFRVADTADKVRRVACSASSTLLPNGVYVHTRDAHDRLVGVQVMVYDTDRES